MNDQKIQPLYCQNCRHENPEGSLFCEKCGTRLEIPKRDFFPDTDSYEEKPTSYESYTEPESYDSYSEAESYESYTEPVIQEPSAEQKNQQERESGPAQSSLSFDSEKIRESAGKVRESAGKAASAAGSILSSAAKTAKDTYKNYADNKEKRSTPVAEGLNGRMQVNKTIRKYFGMSGMLLSIGIIAAGVVLIFTGIGALIGLVVVIIGLVIFFSAGFSGEKETDQATKREIERLTSRGIDKLYEESEEIGLINPVVVTGFGASPDASLSVTEQDFAKKSFFSFLKPRSSFDPAELYRVGSDDIIRSMLLQVTVYAFSEDQLFLYTGNVDISTGAIYNEGVSEIYYRDISSINMSQELSKIYNKKNKKFTYYVREYINILGSGMAYTSSMQSVLGKGATEQEFMGMKHLIRDKKKSLA